jgi:hypothetical protein
MVWELPFEWLGRALDAMWEKARLRLERRVLAATRITAYRLAA